MPQLSRNIGLVSLILYGVGDILGAGIYGLVGKAAGEMGNAVWLAFLASMVAAGLTGLSYASLGSRYPRAAGAAYVISLAYRRGCLAYVVGLAVLASGMTSMAVASRAFAGYLHGMIPAIPEAAAVLSFAILIGVIVFRGIRESMWVNALCTIVELTGLLFVIAVGVAFWGNVNYLNAVTVANPTGEISLSLILTGAVLTFYSFIGFEDMLNISEEVKEPQRTIPIALISAVAISSIIYICVSVTAVSVVPAGELATSSKPLVEVVMRAAPWFPPALFGLIAMFAVANTALLNFVMGTRLMYGMANQKLMPKILGKVHAKRQTPHVAIFAVFIILVVLALSGDISTLAKATSVLLLSSFILVNSALVILKMRKDEPHGRFEVPVIIPVGGALVCAAMLSQAQAPELIRAGIIVTVIVGLYFVLRPSVEKVEQRL